MRASTPGPGPGEGNAGNAGKGREGGPDARAELGAAVAVAAGRIADVLDRHPVLPGPYPLTGVLRELAAQQAALQGALEAYPLALAMDEDGRPDPLGPDLAGLMGQVLYVLVLYRNLEDIPDRLRVQAHRNLSAAHLRARHVRDRGPRRARR